MQRFLYFAGFTYIAICGAMLFSHLVQRRTLPGEVPVHAEPVPVVLATSGNSAERWFASMKPYCNPVEVEVRTRYQPAPQTSEGAGYAAACFALAGKIERARAIIDSMPAQDRGAAANVLFNVAHPVADAGDDRSSGPMMALVLEYWPNNYMALYHAGMSEYALGETALAEKHLRAFLEMYVAPDGFRSAAKAALWKIERRARQSTPRRVERETTPRP